ncbi:RNA polymerase sigma-70 factor [Serinicoccus hydrothermalis]|uniref:RNA polymerase sigma-70 factor n=1 Tax=Serinicoccus hydrothermalis TaxID=1758689 RepID=A0A1B1N9S9_9MICO|nr:ECF RNA polymerase sigma factor SigK [Serinicoccus hydrothermalis]ANS78193.1 RNA polymerase sigma-70 factor [Serinicoccus hydrothermalis]
MGPATGAGSLTSDTHDHDPGNARVVDVSEAGRPDLIQLLGLVADGDQTSLAQLYDLLSPRVFGLALRVVRDRAMAEEVVQDVFLQIWRQAGEVDPSRGSPLGWVLTLTHRRAVDRVRSEQAQSDRLDRYESQQTTPPYDATAEEAVERMEATRVRTALDRIGEPHRTTVALAYFSGLTHREVAQRMDVPLGTAKTRIRDGLTKLRKQLDGGEQG